MATCVLVEQWKKRILKHFIYPIILLSVSFRIFRQLQEKRSVRRL